MRRAVDFCLRFRQRRLIYSPCSYKTVLVIGADSMSHVVDWSDRSTCILFGDELVPQYFAERKADCMYKQHIPMEKREVFLPGTADTEKIGIFRKKPGRRIFGWMGKVYSNLRFGEFQRLWKSFWKRRRLKKRIFRISFCIRRIAESSKQQQRESGWTVPDSQ